MDGGGVVRNYLLGVATPFVVAAVSMGLFWLWIAVTEALDDHWGITFEAKNMADREGISEYVLKHNIWWERSFGPVFCGGWYREDTRRRVNRWVGFGSHSGRCFMIFRSLDLGEVAS